MSYFKRLVRKVNDGLLVRETAVSQPPPHDRPLNPFIRTMQGDDNLFQADESNPFEAVVPDEEDRPATFGSQIQTSRPVKKEDTSPSEPKRALKPEDTLPEMKATVDLSPTIEPEPLLRPVETVKQNQLEVQLSEAIEPISRQELATPFAAETAVSTELQPQVISPIERTEPTLPPSTLEKDPDNLEPTTIQETINQFVEFSQEGQKERIVNEASAFLTPSFEQTEATVAPDLPDLINEVPILQPTEPPQPIVPTKPEKPQITIGSLKVVVSTPSLPEPKKPAKASPRKSRAKRNRLQRNSQSKLRFGIGQL